MKYQSPEIYRDGRWLADVEAMNKPMQTPPEPDAFNIWELGIYQKDQKTGMAYRLVPIGFYQCQSEGIKDKEHLETLMKSHGLIFLDEGWLALSVEESCAGDSLAIFREIARREREVMDEKIWALAEGQGITRRTTASLMVIPGPDFMEPKPKAVTACR